MRDPSGLRLSEVGVTELEAPTQAGEPATAAK